MAEQLEEFVGRLLREASLTLAVAESCTGGLLGSRLTDVSGSSDYFLGGVIAYHDDMKRGVLDVPASIILEHGAVSAESALAMAHGVRDLAGADIGVSVTGIAGPNGSTPAKPVGTVYIGLADSVFEQVKHFAWQGDRITNKQLSVDASLKIIIEYLKRDA